MTGRGNSLAVEWLGLRTFTAEGVGSIKPCGVAPPKKKNDRKKITASLENMEKVSPDQKF